MTLPNSYERSIEIICRLSQPETEVIEEALTSFLPRISAKLQELKGGLSGSQVYRVNATCGIPLLDASCSLRSFVIKLNSEESFHQEAVNYSKNIPRNLTKYFAEINIDRLFQASKDKRIWFLIMEDLADYDPLYEMIHLENGDSEELSLIIKKLCTALEEIYLLNGDIGSLYKNSAFIVKSLYIGKMERTLNLIARAKEIEISQEKINRTRSLLSDISSRKELEPPYLSIMHGDLHTRNIMVRRKDNDIKFIDLDNFSNLGDYIYDIGELIIHTSFVAKISEIESPTLTENNYDSFLDSDYLRNLSKIEATLVEKTKEIAAKFSDVTYESRLLLAESRFLLTCVFHEEDQTKASIFYEKATQLLENCARLVRPIKETEGFIPDLNTENLRDESD